MDRDKLQVYALVAEVLSGIAVVVTLVFLVIEMRESTSATQAQTYQLLMREMNDYRALVAQADMAVIVDKVYSDGWDSLNRVDQRRLYSMGMINWGFYESAYYANKRGVLGDEEWQRFKRAYCRRRKEQSFVWEQEKFTPLRQLLTSEFLEYVESNCN